MTTSDVYELASQLAALKEQIKGQKVPSLAYSTIESGAVTVVDEYDATKGLVGMQFDGAVLAQEINGPAPLTPTTPILTGAGGSLSVRWDGLWADGDVVPSNFTRVEIHIQQDSTPAGDVASTIYGTFETPRGGEQSFTLAPGTYYVALVARNASGARGPVSDAAFADVTTVAADTTQLEADVKTAKDTADAAKATADQANTDVAAIPAQIDAAKAAAISQAGTNADAAYSGTKTLVQGWVAVGDTTIDGGKVKADSITALQIAADAITANELLAGAVVAGKLAADAVVATNIAADAVLARNIKAGEVVAGKLAAGAVIAGTIAANAVTAGTIAALAVKAGNIDALAVTATELAAGAVTADKIKAGEVTAGKLAAGAVIAGNIAANAVTATTLAADAIDGKTITGATVRTAATGQRWVLGTGSGANTLYGYSGRADETSPYGLQSLGDGVKLTGAGLSSVPNGVPAYISVGNRNQTGDPTIFYGVITAHAGSIGMTADGGVGSDGKNMGPTLDLEANGQGSHLGEHSQITLIGGGDTYSARIDILSSGKVYIGGEQGGNGRGTLEISPTTIVAPGANSLLAVDRQIQVGNGAAGTVGILQVNQRAVTTAAAPNTNSGVLRFLTGRYAGSDLVDYADIYLARRSTTAGDHYFIMAADVSVSGDIYTSGKSVTGISTATVTSYSNNFSAASTADDHPVVIKRAGLVSLKGRVKQSAGFTGGVAFTLPQAYWPAQPVNNVLLVTANPGNAAGPFIAMSVATNGQVSLTNSPNSTAPWQSGTWIVLSLHYLAADF